MRRLLALAGLCAATTAAIVACSKAYSAADDAPATPDGGGEAAISTDAPSETTVACDAAKTSTDPKNCGTCGHDCLGGACSGGRCAPVLLGTSSDAPLLDVVVDATRVLWTTTTALGGGEGNLYACPKTGCPGAPSILAAKLSLGSLASDGVKAYASFLFGARQIVRIEPGGALTKLPLADHPYAPWLVVRPDGLYVLAHGEPDGGNYERSVTLWDGAKETRVAVYAPADKSNTVPMLVTDDRVYLGARNIGRIIACTKNDCSVWSDVTTDTVAFADSMATDGKRIFWTNFGPLESCPINTAPCAATQELGAPQLGSGLAQTVTYAAGVLYIETDAGDILACDPSACSTTVEKVAHETELALANRGEGHTITADDRAIYWAAVDRGANGGPTYRIMKLAK